MLWSTWAKFINPPPPPPPPQPVAQDTTVKQTVIDTSASATKSPELPIASGIPPPKPDRPERLVRVENRDFIAIFSSYGGILKSLELKKYTTENGGGKIPVQLVGVNKSDPWKTGGALTLGRDDSLSQINYLPFEITGGDIILSEKDSSKTLVFTYTGPESSAIRKEYTFASTGYQFKMNLAIDKPQALGFNDKVTVGWLAPLLPTEKDYNEDLGKFAGFYSMGVEVVEQNKVDKGKMRQISTGLSRWIAVRSKYFANVVIAGKTEADEILLAGVQDTIQNAMGKVFAWKKFALGLSFDLKGKSFSNDFTIYTGPLDYFILQKMGNNLGKLVDMGWNLFRPFAVAILWFFVQLHRVLFNYGLVIIFFSIIIKLIFWPLTRKSNASMYKMKELAPKMADLKTRYKDEPQKINTETMKLYREYGVNPFSSCLPILIQLPIFWAMFSVLKNSIELRAANLAFWITDLSQKDQFYVLPIIMGISMFIQQKMTITDPKQKMMAYMMPVIFTVLFAQWPSGLVLYWTVFNIISIFETMIIKRRMEEEKKVVS
jgi:YidC/Oxa1 family membrane protein insertase